MMHSRSPMWAAALLASVAVVPRLASAQDADFLALDRAIQNTAPSSVVRLQLRDERLLTGSFLRADSSGIEISTSGGLARVSRADVARYWQRGRAVRGGAISFGAVGAGFGALIGALLASTCETCSSDDSPLAGAVAGGAVMGGLGVAVGAILGAAIPRWSLRWEDTTPDGDAAAPVLLTTLPAEGQEPRRRIGELSLQVVGGHGRVEPDPFVSDLFASREGPMLGLLAGLSFRSGRWGFGPELLWMKGDPDLTALTGIVHFDLARSDAGIVPYLLTGLGGYSWIDETLLTVPLGLGANFGDDHRWRAEVRWHQLVHHGSLERPSLLTIGAGRRLAW